MKFTDYYFFMFNFIGNMCSPIYSFFDHQVFVHEVLPPVKSSPYQLLTRFGIFLASLAMLLLGGRYLNVDTILDSSLPSRNFIVKALYFQLHAS